MAGDARSKAPPCRTEAPPVLHSSIRAALFLGAVLASKLCVTAALAVYGVIPHGGLVKRRVRS